MKNDKRIYRPEQLTEAEKDKFFRGLDKYLDEKHEKEQADRDAAADKRAKEIEEGKRIVINGRDFLKEYLSVNSILTAYNMNMRQLSDRFEIPYRTIQNWCEKGENHRECPAYVLKMMIEILER